MKSIDFLLEKEDINHPDISGETVDFNQARKRSVKYLKFLCEKCKPGKRNKQGETVLDIFEKMEELFISNEKEKRKIDLMKKIYKRELTKK